MREVFAKPNELTSSFENGLVYCGIFVIFVFVLLWLNDRRKPIQFTAKNWFVFGAVTYICVSLMLYTSIITNFESVEVNGNDVVLYFAEPHKRKIIFQRSEVSDVLYDFSSKRLAPKADCFVRFILNSGSSYSSASRPESTESCKALRLELLKSVNNGT